MGADFKIFGVTPAVVPLGYAAYPVTDSLKDLFWLGTDAASSRDNQVAGRSDATIADGGGIAYHDGYVTFGGSLAANRMALATNDNEFGQRTYIAVMEHLGPVVSSNDWRAAIGYYGGTATGMALFQNVATAGNGALRQAGIGVPTPPQSRFYFIALTYSTDDKTLRSYYGDDGELLASGSIVLATNPGGAGAPVLIGGNGTIGTNNRTINIAMAAQHNAPLSGADLQKIYTYVRGQLIDKHALDVA